VPHALLSETYDRNAVKLGGHLTFSELKWVLNQDEPSIKNDDNRCVNSDFSSVRNCPNNS
jgi:hypothetical protein